ncbi:MAG: radical SAM protein [Candidatus Omnitrophota bacterium]
MKELQYKTFSRKTHSAGLLERIPSSCQFELTFGCGLRCRHCYSDCYNKPEFIRKELGTESVKLLLDKIRRQGVIWLCFTGGDPLTRKDFCEIYSYARKKGFLISVFTSGYSLNNRILELFKDQPPFVVEITLNAADKKMYERISQVRGSFLRAVNGIKALTRAKIAVKIKTMVTKDNIGAVGRIKKFLADNGYGFDPDYYLFARLNGDIAPCELRISPAQVLAFAGKGKLNSKDPRIMPARNLNKRLFWCALGAGQEFHIDPYGNMFLCPVIRDSPVNIVKRPIAPAFKRMIAEVRDRVCSSAAKCASCEFRAWCLNCPGKAYSQTRDMESPVPYYCALTKQLIKDDKRPG